MGSIQGLRTRGPVNINNLNNPRANGGPSFAEELQPLYVGTLATVLLRSAHK